MKIPKKASLLLLCCMTGCNGQETELPSSPAITVPQETAAAEDSSLSVQKNQNKKEIPVDFPFFESEPYTLMLALTDESHSEYELRLYDKYETILQQIPCGTLTEPIRFSYDGLIYGTLFYDLEIFPADSSTGLFFDWNEKDADPMYQYFDQYHNLQLELYHDETTGQFCGIVYQYRFIIPVVICLSMLGETAGFALVQSFCRISQLGITL